LTVGPKVSRPLAFERILYATDFLPTAAHALQYAVSLTQKYDADLLVLHVNNENSQEPPVEAASRTFDFLGRYFGEYSTTGMPDKSKVIVDFGPTADVILEHAVDRDVDLIVIGLRHLNDLRARIGAHLPGSTAYACASQARCPILTVPLPKHN
jgi:nucleotide-binding universal stress UspA family protein